MDWITGAKIQIIFDIAKLFWCKSVMCRGNTWLSQSNGRMLRPSTPMRLGTNGQRGTRDTRMRCGGNGQRGTRCRMRCGSNGQRACSKMNTKCTTLAIHIRRSFLPCTSLPYSHTAAWPQGSRHSMYCAHSSEWGLFGRNTRSAFRRTPSLNKQHFLVINYEWWVISYIPYFFSLA